jgi:hypothetical protein
MRKLVSCVFICLFSVCGLCCLPYQQAATGSRGLFTEEGQLLTEGRIFAMSDLPTAVCLTDIDNDGGLDLLANRGNREQGRTALLLFENTIRRLSANGPLAGSAPVIAEIPIETARNKTIVPVTAGGRKLRLILDTGNASDGILIFDRDKVDTEILGPAMIATVSGAGSGTGSNALVFERAKFEVGIEISSRAGRQVLEQVAGHQHAQMERRTPALAESVIAVGIGHIVEALAQLDEAVHQSLGDLEVRVGLPGAVDDQQVSLQSLGEVDRR